MAAHSVKRFYGGSDGHATTSLGEPLSFDCCRDRHSQPQTSLKLAHMNAHHREAHHVLCSQDRNETLFYRLLIDDFTHMAPIVYTPTVGWASVNFHHVRERAPSCTMLAPGCNTAGDCRIAGPSLACGLRASYCLTLTRCADIAVQCRRCTGGRGACFSPSRTGARWCAQPHIAAPSHSV